MDRKRKIAQGRDGMDFPVASKSARLNDLLHKNVEPCHSTHQTRKLEAKDSGVDLLEDSFECLEDTQTLINKGQEVSKEEFTKFLDYELNKNISQLDTSKKLYGNSSKKSYDAFKLYMDENKPAIASSNLDNDKSQFSLSFNKTQILRQIDNILQNTTNLKKDHVELNAQKKAAPVAVNSSFINKNEVSNLFDKLEHTISELRPDFNQERNGDKDASLDAKLLNTIVEKVKGSKNNQQENLLENGDINEIFNITELENLAGLFDENFMPNEFKIATCVPFKSFGPFYGLPDKVKSLLKQYKGIDNLYAWQDECLNLPAIKSRKNLIYALPTSGGKTLVAEILLLREILCRNKNVLLVLPFVAIVQEKVWDLSSFAVPLEFLVEEYAGGKGTYPPKKRRRKNTVYVATIEKAMGLVNSLIETERLSELGLVVVDELHLIGDPSRGPTLESFLTKLIYLKNSIQIIGMSATIGNLNELCAFLDADVYTRDFRPVELVEYVKVNDDIAKIDYKADEDEFFVHERTMQVKYSEANLKTDPDKLGALVMEVIPKGSCLIFCPSKKNCENVAMLLCKVIFASVKEYKKSEKLALLEALKNETQSLCSVLRVSIQFGIAYHHSGLTAEERQLIEHGFRAGTISVICCTSTLAAGVNLPAKRVILRQPYIGRDFINLSRYKQMVGRAGRAGLEERGESILICLKNELPRVKNLLMAPMDLSLSHMHEGKHLRQFLLSCISLNLAVTRPEMQQISRKTLLCVQESRLDANLKKLVDAAITDLFTLGAIEISTNTDNPATSSPNASALNVSNRTNRSSTSSSSKTRIILTRNTKLQITTLGLAAIRAGLELTKAHLLYDDLIQAQASLVLLNCLHLIYLVTPYDVAEQIKIASVHYYSVYSGLGRTELETARVLGIDDACAMKLLSNKPIKSVPERVMNRFYVSLMLFDLWNEIPVYKVSEKYQIDRGLVQNLMISAASFAANVVSFCTVLTEFWPFACLLNGMSTRLQHCCVRELVHLMELPNVKQSRARQLYNAGFKTLQSIAKADPNALVQKIEYMSRKVANQLISTSKMLLLEKVENLREAAEDVLEGTEASLPIIS